MPPQRARRYASGQLQRQIVSQLSRQPYTLAELQAATGASMPTVRRALEDLIEGAWVVPVGQNMSTGGRRATRFGLNGESHLIIGAHIAIPDVNCVVRALDGTLLDQQCLTGANPLLPDDAVAIITAYVEQVRNRYPERQILGIGVTTPGYMDAAREQILYVGRAEGWQNFPLKMRLEEVSGLPVVLENDTDCLLRAELDYLGQPPARDLIYLAVLDGVKLSMMLDGQIYSGSFGNAGIIGRTRMRSTQPDDALYNLEDVASVGALCAAFDRQYRQLNGAGPELEQITAIAEREVKFAAILAAAARGEPVTNALVNRFFDDLSLALANIIFVLQPLVLIVGGQLCNMPVELRGRFENAVREHLPPLLRNHLSVRYAALTGRFAPASGAAQWFLKHAIQSGIAFELPPGQSSGAAENGVRYTPQMSSGFNS
ncbi:MAG: ROK family transcriptional regulator [Chloroflexota bacterium]